MDYCIQFGHMIQQWFCIVQFQRLQRMPYEQSSAKKKRIILSTHRKTTQQHTAKQKQIEDHGILLLKEFQEQNVDHTSTFNFTSVNNSLEIFDDDPKNRHFQFLDNEEDKFEPAETNEKSRTGLLQTMPSTANVHNKTKHSQHLPIQSTFSKIGTITLSSLHASAQPDFTKKVLQLNRKFIDLTLKRDAKRLSHQSSAASLSLREQPSKNCISRSNIFQTERSILSVVSVNSVQFSTSSTSERKKALTITCHKYDGVKGKKMKTESISKCNSIKLLQKCI